MNELIEIAQRLRTIAADCSPAAQATLVSAAELLEQHASEEQPEPAPRPVQPSSIYSTPYWPR